MAVIENLDIVLGARTQKLDAGLDRSRAKVKDFESDVNRMSEAAKSAFAPLQGLVMGLIGSIPGANAAIAAFTGITAALAAGTTAKVAREVKQTSEGTGKAAVQMTAFATAASQAAVATTVMARNSRIGLPAPRASGLARYNPATAMAGALGGVDDAIDAEFTVLNRIAPQATAARAALGGMSVAGVAAGAAVAAGFVAVASAAAAAVVTIRGVREQMGQIDEMAKNAATVGVTFRELAGFRMVVGESAGLGPEAADNALKKLQIRLVEAQQNGGALADQLSAMGLDAGRLLEAGPIQAMRELSNATRQMKSPTDQLTLAYRLFEEEGSKLVNTLRAGPEAITSTMEAADQLGLTLTDAQAKQVEAANDAWARVQSIGTGAFRQIAAEVAPYITAIANSITEIHANFGPWKGAIQPAIDALMEMLGLIADLAEAQIAIPKAMAEASAGNFAAAGETIKGALTLDGADALKESAEAARESARLDAELAKQRDRMNGVALTPEADSSEAAAAAQSAAEEQARAAQQKKDAIGGTLMNLADEIIVLQSGTAELERQKLIRQGANEFELAALDALTQTRDRLEEINELRDKGKAIMEQYASPEEKLDKKLQDLQKMVDIGAIDVGTAERAAKEAAQELGGQRRETPTFGALQRGSVEAYSAGLKNERAGQQEKLAQEGNKLLGQVNTWLQGLNEKVGNLTTIGNAG